MDELRIYCSQTQPDLILLNDRIIERIIGIQITQKANEHPHTTYGLLGAYPNHFRSTPDSILSNEYPLHIVVGNTLESTTRILWKRRPISMITELDVHLWIQPVTNLTKRLIRFTTTKLNDELRNELIDFGIEIIEINHGA